MDRITAPYLLTTAAPIKVDCRGTRWTNELWAKDLALHLDYIENLTLACPRIFAEPISSDAPLNVHPFQRINFIELDQPRNHLDAIKLLPSLAKTMWRAVKECAIVHTGFGSWPISEGLISSPLAKLQRKFLITYVESSFWRTSDPEATLYHKVRAAILERLNKLCVRHADLRFFTSQAYLDSFLVKGSPNAYVAPASWIDASTILDNSTFAADCLAKAGPVKLLFAGRLNRDKGLQIFLDAAVTARKRSDLVFSVIGEGPMRPECERASDHIALIEPLPYGESLFRLLREQDAIVVPSLSDEQPRVIFDAFSQGIPVIGSDTGGICEIIRDGINGRIFRAGDVEGLATVMDWAISNRATLQSLGAAALSMSRHFTHQSMHEKRSSIIARAYLKSRAVSADG